MIITLSMALVYYIRRPKDFVTDYGKVRTWVDKVDMLPAEESFLPMVHCGSEVFSAMKMTLRLDMKKQSVLSITTTICCTSSHSLANSNLKYL